MQGITRRVRGTLGAFVAGGIATLVLFSGGAYANHQFSDVSDGHPFHEAIDDIKTAGITTGFEDGTYRPGAPVSRGAMAAFMSRGFSSVAQSDPTGSHILATGVATQIGNVFVRPGATGDNTNGYVLVTATAQLIATSGCPCDVRVSLSNLNTGTLAEDFETTTIPAGGDDVVDHTTVTIQRAFEIAGGSVDEYEIVAQLNDANAMNVTGSALVSAIYVPFDSEVIPI